MYLDGRGLKSTTALVAAALAYGCAGHPSSATLPEAPGAAGAATVRAPSGWGYRVIYYFSGYSGDGIYPVGDLIRDTAGNLFGVTIYGGAYRVGTAYKFSASGHEKILRSFPGSCDGVYPEAGLTQDADGNLYGTTYNGCNGTGESGGDGIIFELSHKGAETELHEFSGSDGEHSLSRLIRDTAGNLYGTTRYGGTSGYGVVFKLSAGTETVLHDFAAGSDGAFPLAGLAEDNAGNLYGTTHLGGANDEGTVFMVTPNGTEKVLYSFGGTHGEEPSARLILGPDNDLYGTTTLGGSVSSDGGVVFRLTPSGSEKVLHSFGGANDGSIPAGGVIRDAHGNLFGATRDGGSNAAGTIYEITAAGKESVLYSLPGGPGGATPDGGLAKDPSGALYGVTESGGNNGAGVLYKVTPP